MSKRDCVLATVVERSGCSVCICNHGILHVTLGSVTVRMNSDSLEPVAAVFADAVSEMRRADAALRESPMH
jgi:hypothetical protein